MATAAAAGPSANLPAGWLLRDVEHVGIGDAVSFDVPAGTASLLVHLQGEMATTAVSLPYADYDLRTLYTIDPWPNFAVPARVTLPNGETLFEYLDAFTTPLDPTLASGYFAPNAWSATFAVPSSHRLADLALARGDLPAGTWKVEVTDFQAECDLFGGCPARAASTYRVTAVAKPGPYAGTGKVGIAFYFASNSPSAATARSSLAFQVYVARIDELLSRAGIAVDAVTFFDLPPAAVSEFSITDFGTPPCDELSRLFRLADPRHDGVHVFLVEELLSGMGNVVGYTGSIPGPTGSPGAASGGVVTSLSGIDLKIGTSNTPCGAAFDLHCNADFWAYVTAHEIGHWLGLYHPTESTGGLYDPLSDTTTCSCEACGAMTCPAPEPYGLAAEWCADPAGPCRGADNLMFWQVDELVSQGAITREQAFVMRANPAVRSAP
jgi:hypothetical protein